VQTLVDEATGTYSMSGSLVGDWFTDSFDCHLIPGGAGVTWPCSGTEHFIGCLDADADGTCELNGRLDFTFVYTGTPVGNGRCHHPIVSGEGAFEGATGQLTFKDRLGVCGLTTTYKGQFPSVSHASGGSAARCRRPACSVTKGDRALVSHRIEPAQESQLSGCRAIGRGGMGRCPAWDRRLSKTLLWDPRPALRRRSCVPRPPAARVAYRREPRPPERRSGLRRGRGGRPPLPRHALCRRTDLRAPSGEGR
jgi:hypothetical protein